MAVHSIELCAGVGMLGEGTRAAFDFYGIKHRTICYVEREAAAAGQLVALMEAGILDPAPVWSDLLTFDGAAWRGKVDCLIAGFPCQDLSIAGRRAGLNGKRSGLFFDICDLADDCGAQLLVLENVSAIASATATVVDEAEELEERAAARVMGELADRGWDSEWITIRASDVGASHQRARWFCFAWRVADSEHAERRPERVTGDCRQQGKDGERKTDSGVGVAEQTLDDAGCGNARRNQHQPGAGGGSAEHQLGCEAVADSARNGRHGFGGEGRRGRGICETGVQLGQPARDRWREGRPKSAGQQGRHDAAEHGRPVANTQSERTRAESLPLRVGPQQRNTSNIRRHVANPGSQRHQGREQRRTCTGNGGGQKAHGSAEQLCGALPIFAPWPEDGRWPGILEHFPHLAPATEPGICSVVDGVPLLVDKSRNHQLRAIGNGVVPLQAATAIVELFRRSGIGVKAWKSENIA